MNQSKSMGSDKKARITTGDKYGRWTVLYDSITDTKGKRRWLCRCECGTERYVQEISLLYGGSMSCGCLRKENVAKALSPDLTGNKFGELTVIRKVEHPKGGAVRWLCKCSCGADYEVKGTLLVTGRKTHCSSKVHRKKRLFSDITGQRFGRLTAMYPTEQSNKGRYIIWRCQCDCGNQLDVSYNQLMYTHQKSCGCQKKEQDQKLKTFLIHVDGTSVDAIKSKKIPVDNTTGYRGVYLIKGKYVAKITFQKKTYYLGTYDNIKDAAEARKEAEEVLFVGTAEHYQKWKALADKDSTWAAANPVQIIVTKIDEKRLSVSYLPNLKEMNN